MLTFKTIFKKTHIEVYIQYQEDCYVEYYYAPAVKEQWIVDLSPKDMFLGQDRVVKTAYRYETPDGLVVYSDAAPYLPKDWK